MLVEAGGDGAKVLDAIEEALDAVAQPVQALMECGRMLAVVERADVGVCALGFDPIPQGIAIIAAIGEQYRLRRQAGKHVLAALAVVRLALGQLDEDRQAVRIDERVDLGREPAAGTSHATAATAFFSPLAACWWTRTTELSIIWIWPL